MHSTDPAGIGIDALTENDEPIMFISSEFSSGLEIVNPVSLEYMGVSPGPSNLAGVDVDDADDIVYALRRQSSYLYIYQWDPVAQTLTQLDVVNLPGMSSGYGIALDDSRNILWVADTPNRMVRAYNVDVLAWTNIAEVSTLSFSVSHPPVDVTVDTRRNLVYTVGGWAGSHLISKYDVAAGVESTVDLGSESGMGIAVDEITGYVYITGGGYYGQWGGDNLQVWDCSTTPFTHLQSTPDLGNPAGIAIANEGQVVVNPLNLAKNDEVQGVGVPIGQNFTYKITCDNLDNSVDVTGVVVRDDLPLELNFVSEYVNGMPGTGVYDASARTVTWDIGTITAGGTGPLIELVVQINDNAVEGQTIYNYANIWANEVDTSTVIGGDPDDSTGAPGTTPLPPSNGHITGSVIADCPTPGTGLYGVAIDAFDSSGNLAAGAVTDANGYFEMLDLDAGDYTVSLVTPLGYLAAVDEQAISLNGGDTVNVTFDLTCIDIVASPRTIGFWKHQFGVALSGRGKAQIAPADLCTYLDMITDHFNSNGLNQVVVYQPPVSGLCEDKLMVARELLNLKGSVAMIDRARQQLMALLLNVAAGKISQTQVISADGATVSQAITHCDNIIDTPDADYETAKTICDEINNCRMLPAGMIPMSTANIAYKPERLPNDFSLTQNYPNPFNPTTAIGFSLPQSSLVRLEIFNIAGQQVELLVDGQLEAGQHVVEWNARHHASGTYLYRLTANNFVETKKMVLLK